MQQAGIFCLLRSSTVLACSLHFGTQIDYFAGFPVSVQQWLSVSNPSELSLQPRFRSARDQLQLYVRGMRWQHMQERYFLLGHFKAPGFMDTGDTASFCWMHH